MGGHVDVKKPASLQAQHDEDVEQPEGNGRHDCEVDGKGLRQMILQESSRQLCEAGLRWQGRYFDTVDCATVKPSFRSSPWIRGAPRWDSRDAFPRSGHEARLRSWAAPVSQRLLHRQYRRNPRRCQRITVSADEDEGVAPSRPNARWPRPASDPRSETNAPTSALAVEDEEP